MLLRKKLEDAYEALKQAHDCCDSEDDFGEDVSEWLDTAEIKFPNLIIKWALERFLTSRLFVKDLIIEDIALINKEGYIQTYFCRYLKLSCDVYTTGINFLENGRVISDNTYNGPIKDDKTLIEVFLATYSNTDKEDDTRIDNLPQVDKDIINYVIRKGFFTFCRNRFNFPIFIKNEQQKSSDLSPKLYNTQ